MKIPKTVLIKGKTYSTEYKWNLTHEEHGKCDGCIDFPRKHILLDRSLPVSQKPLPYLHEFVHAVLREAHLHEAGGVDGILEEIICSAVSEALLENFELKPRKK